MISKTSRPPIKVMAAEPLMLLAVVFMVWALWFVVVMGARGRCLFIGVKLLHNQIIERFFWGSCSGWFMWIWFRFVRLCEIILNSLMASNRKILFCAALPPEGDKIFCLCAGFGLILRASRTHSSVG